MCALTGRGANNRARGFFWNHRTKHCNCRKWTCSYCSYGSRRFFRQHQGSEVCGDEAMLKKADVDPDNFFLLTFISMKMRAHLDLRTDKYITEHDLKHPLISSHFYFHLTKILVCNDCIVLKPSDKCCGSCKSSRLMYTIFQKLLSDFHI